ncbi:MAG: hypothetical protein M1492_15025 [Gammaproteobacteria bacterium]|nr:hypothetical protein [Gammaproteobacteria bacterium]
MSQSTGTHVPKLSVIDSLNNAPIRFFHPRAAFLDAFIFGRLADVVGRKQIYGLEAL